MQGFSSKPLGKAAAQFARLPGIGSKTASRLAYYLLSLPEEEVRAFCEDIYSARKELFRCSICRNFSENKLCNVCSNENRDKSIICVCETPKDSEIIESARGFQGVYHILHGLISPLDLIGPDDIEINSLVTRLGNDKPVREIIMATSPTIEGEATAIYIAKLIKPFGIKVTRLAYGLPHGGSFEFADDKTITHALKFRNEI